MSTEIELLKRVDPARGSVPTASRQDLLNGLRTDEFPAKKRPSRRRVAVLGVVAGAVLASTGGLAAALWTQAPATALKVNCAAGVTQAEYDRDGGFTSVIDTVSGDPIADCAGQYAFMGEPVPALTAYNAGASYLWVLPSEWQVPPTWQALRSDFRSDSTRLALKQRLDDPVDGPASTCRSRAAVQQMVQRYQDKLGMQGWTTQPAPGAGDADGVQSCAFALMVEDGRRTIYVQTGAAYPPPGDSPEEQAYEALKQRLRAGIAERCLTIAEATDVANRALNQSGIQGSVTSTPAATPRCAAVDLVTGGGPFLILLS